MSLRHFEMAEEQMLVSFEITPDGSLQNIQGPDESLIPDEKTLGRLIFYGRKALLGEEMQSITIITEELRLTLTNTDTLVIGSITKTN